jgi:hypothetical protein
MLRRGRLPPVQFSLQHIYVLVLPAEKTAHARPIRLGLRDSSRQNQTGVPIHSVLSQGVAQMEIAKHPSIVPMVIASA